MIKTSLLGRIYKHRINKDVKDIFIDINDYQKDQGPKETCASDAWENINTLNINSKFTEGAEYFIDEWSESIEEIFKKPNAFMES